MPASREPCSVPSLSICTRRAPVVKVRQLGRTGTRVSELALGTLTFGRETGQQESASIVGAFIAAGGNLIDTANVYGDGASESALGAILSPHRDAVILSTKFRFHNPVSANRSRASRRAIRQAVTASLARLRTDWIDLYSVHCWDPVTPIEETMSTLHDLVREGLVRYIGLSTFAAWQVAVAIGVARQRNEYEPDVVHARYSLLSREAEAELLPFAAYAELGVLAWEPLGGGLLTGKYLQRLAGPGSRGGGNKPWNEAFRERAVVSDASIVEAVSAAAQELGGARPKLLCAGY